MAFVVKVFKTLRNNWKKSVAFTAIGIYGVKYANERYDEELLRRQYCAEAKIYGEQKQPFGAQCRKITVFLNPAASGGGAKKLFEKNAAPLLYLAGLEVNVVKTEYDGQVKEFLKHLEQKHVDGIVVAGGNATLVETITGIMKKDEKAFRQKIPIGVIPVGNTNKFAKFFYGPEKGDVRRSLDAAMAVVKGGTQNLDVLKLEGENGRSTYALCGVEIGAYRDAKERIKKYWYFGPLKHRFSYLRKTLGSWPPTVEGSLEYVVATETNTKQKVKKTVAPSQDSWSWRKILFSSKTVQKPTLTNDDEVDVVVDEDDEVVKIPQHSTIELTVNSGFSEPDKIKKAPPGVDLGIGPETISKSDFITEGWRRIQDKDWKIGSEENKHHLVKWLKYVPQVQEGAEMWYSIDGEYFEAIPIEVTLLKNRLKIFTLPADPSVSS